MAEQSTEPRDMREYIRPVLRRWWLVLAVVPVVTIGTYLYYDHKPKVYSASTELFVQPQTVNQLLLGNTYYQPEATIENLALLIQTRTVANQAAKSLAKSHGQVAGSVSARAVENSNFIVVTGTAPTPQGAALLANAYSDAFINAQQRQLRGEAARTIRLAERQLAELGNSADDRIKRETIQEKIQTLELLESQSSGAGSGVKVVERAFPSSVPVGHDPESNAIFAFVLSLMLAIGAAFGLEYLTRKLTSVENVENTMGLPVLTEAPKVNNPTPFNGNGMTIDRQLHEPFRRLQMNLDMLSRERPLGTILVASAAPGEGKSIVTRNLALAYREAGRNVAVMDADFRKATLGNLMSAREGPGLTDILAGRASFDQAVQQVAVPALENGNGSGAGPMHPHQSLQQGREAHSHIAPGHTQTSPKGLGMVPAGVHSQHLAAELNSGWLSHTLSTAAQLYDCVLIDSSPVLAAADVLPLLSQVDGVLLVTRLGVTTRDSAKRVLKELKRIPNVNLIGVVVNGIPARTYRSRAYGYYYG